MFAAQVSLALAVIVALIADVVGATVPDGTWVFAMGGLVILGLARAVRYGGFSTLGGAKVSPPAVASDGWRKDTFRMDGLEEDGEALQEYTDEARTYGYRRERGDDTYSWRFTRDQR